jgi:hypothetical protein
MRGKCKKETTGRGKYGMSWGVVWHGAMKFTVTVKVSGTGDPVVTPAPGPVLIGTRAVHPGVSTVPL